MKCASLKQSSRVAPVSPVVKIPVTIAENIYGNVTIVEIIPGDAGSAFSSKGGLGPLRVW